MPKEQRERTIDSAAATPSGYVGTVSGVAPGGLDVHTLSGPYHTGLLLWTQLSKSGSSLADLITRNYSDLVGRTHVLADAAGLGADHSVSGLTVGHVLRASAVTAAAFAQLSHSDLGSVTANQHHNQIHAITGGDHTIGGSNYDVVGKTAGGVLGLLTPSADVSGPAEAILKSTSAGLLTVASLAATTKVTTPLIDTTGGADLTLQPADDLVLDPASNLVKAVSSVAIQADNYASQVTGWRVTYDGQGDFRYLYTDELHAKKFIADLEQALAGGQIIAKSVGMLGATFTAPAAGATATLTMRDLPSAEDMAIFESGDIVRIRNFSRAAGSLSITDCWGVVTSYADQANKLQTWTFTRSAAPNAGAMTAGETVAVDSIVLDYGTTGNGFYEVNAIDGLYGANSPYAQTVTWTTHPHSGQTVRTRMGNLYGIFSVTDEFGLYAGTGVTDSSQYLRISSNAVQLNNVPLNLRNSGTLTVELQADGDARFGSNVAAIGTTALAIFSNAQTYNSEALGAGDIIIGDHSAGHMLWDESAGQLKFRQSTTTRAYVGTDGKIYWGTGEGLLDDDGIALTMTTNYGSGTGENSKITYYQTPSTRTDPIMALYGSDAYGYTYDSSVQPKNRVPGLIIKARATTSYPTIQLENSSGTQQPVWMTNNPWGNLDTGSDTIDIATRAVRARSSAGLSLTDDGGLGLFVKDGGNIGVGTSSPSSRLHLYGNSATDGGEFVKVQNYGSYAAGLYLDQSGTGGHAWTFFASGADNSLGAGPLVLRDSTAGANRLVIDTSGRVGIGDDTPDYDLDVVGDIYASGAIAGDSINSTDAYQRAGVDGYVFVPVTPVFVTDTSGNTWQARVIGGTGSGHYTIDCQAAANGSMPAAAKAVSIIMAVAVSTGPTNSKYVCCHTTTSGTRYGVYCRGQVAGLEQDSGGIVALDASGNFILTCNYNDDGVGGGTVSVLVDGYFI